MHVWICLCSASCMRKGRLIYKVRHVQMVVFFFFFMQQGKLPPSALKRRKTYGGDKWGWACVVVWKCSLIVFGVKGMNDTLLLFSSSIDSKHLYIPLSAFEVFICCFSHAFALPRKNDMIQPFSSTLLLTDSLLYTFTHLRSRSLHASLRGLMTHLVRSVQIRCWVFLLALPSWPRRGCQSDEWKTCKRAPNGALISGAYLAHQQFSVDKGTLQKNNLSLRF